MKFLKKRKADKIEKLKTRVVELEEENGELQQQVFHYRLKKGNLPEPRVMKIMKMMGNQRVNRTGKR